MNVVFGDAAMPEKHICWTVQNQSNQQVIAAKVDNAASKDLSA